MSSLLRLIAATLFAFLAPSAPSFGQPPAAVSLGPAESASIARIETYMNSVRTVSARFLQVSSTGGMAEGDIFISRPGKMRIEYRPPVPILIVADGTWLIYYDRQLGQVSYLPLGSTPAGILVEDQISFQGGGLTVTAFEQGAETLRVTVVRSEDPFEGSLTLVFSDSPLALRKWTVVDAQGVITDVSLVDARFNVPVDPQLFRFRDPRIFKEND